MRVSLTHGDVLETQYTTLVTTNY